MNATELAAEFGRMAAQAEATRKRAQLLSGYEASALEAEANAFRIAQELVTKHLCTTNPLHDTAPDMLAVLEEVVVWFDSLPAGHMDNKWPDGLYDTVLTATARAKGTLDV